MPACKPFSATAPRLQLFDRPDSASHEAPTASIRTAKEARWISVESRKEIRCPVPVTVRPTDLLSGRHALPDRACHSGPVPNAALSHVGRAGGMHPDAPPGIDLRVVSEAAWRSRPRPWTRYAHKGVVPTRYGAWDPTQHRSDDGQSLFWEDGRGWLAR